MLLGLLRANSGTVRLLGGDPWRDAVALHRRIAYVPGDVTLWPNLTGLQAIDFLARLRGDGAVDTRRRDELIERFELDPHKKARTYSKGNRQKVAIVAAFSTNAELYILDEPTSGLDPLMEKAFQTCVHEVADQRRRRAAVQPHPRRGREALRQRDDHPFRSRGEVRHLDELRHLMRTTIKVRTHSDGQKLQSTPFVHDFSIDDGHYDLLGRPQRPRPRDGAADRFGDHRSDRDAGLAGRHVPARVPGSGSMSTATLAPAHGRT